MISNCFNIQASEIAPLPFPGERCKLTRHCYNGLDAKFQFWFSFASRASLSRLNDPSY